MTTPDVYRDAEYIADVSGIQYGSVAETSPTLRDEGVRKKLRSAAKLAFIDRLLHDLDILIYCELSALYYMDCSIVLFAIRAIVQLIFFTRKAPPFPRTQNQPFIGAIFGSNIFCMLVHHVFSRPEAGEATRGYLHGGILIDFIGQKAPIPVARLLFLDLLVLLIDLVMLGLIIEQVKTAGSTDSTSTGTTTTTTTVTEPTHTQDHDHEERGLLNHGEREPSSSTPSSPTSVNNNDSDSDGDGISAREPNSRDSSRSNTNTNTNTDTNGAALLGPEEQLERTRLLADPSEIGHTVHQHALDDFASGEAVIMHMRLFTVIRDQWQYRPPVARRTHHALTSQRHVENLGIQLGADGRL
ncbi:hypothetical protein P175DRAFT_0560778 [Aspergillus ochraceoroseus IBT 24754]|uniref:DUF1746 domain-containing protein n=2 Tax=Aspergillus ochraceoroseus TaxID=138278 RepID=A0A2T5LMP7_9EURO|nr:uncharacterized protein P175DRAFT_0560778 [Aspergillus ochraceoroseus IBT 24754]KKK14827.1 hypothetical protein AOCH_004650 [Aspergillus ochraceoroseus]PTU17553.1 hypothetical protein P175DRAFT_0560778 [Aspergillus ochraceoroseus IBT 24754]